MLSVFWRGRCVRMARWGEAYSMPKDAPVAQPFLAQSASRPMPSVIISTEMPE